MNQKGFASIVLVIIIVAIVVIGGYFVLMRKPTPITQQTPTPAPTQIPVTQQPAPNTGGEKDVGECLIYDVGVQENKISIDVLEGTPGVKKEQVYVDGILGEKITTEETDMDQIYIQAKKDNLWFIQMLTFHPTNKNIDELYAIPDSFRYISPQTPQPNETVNLRTYINSKYGFEIKYPSNFVKLGEGDHYLSIANFSICK